MGSEIKLEDAIKQRDECLVALSAARKAASMGGYGRELRRQPLDQLQDNYNYWAREVRRLDPDSVSGKIQFGQIIPL